MTLPEVLTYLGLLIAAFGATQDYNRLKLALASKLAIALFFLSLFILYISTYEALEEYLKVRCPIGCYLNGFIWDSRHFILVSINLLSLGWIYASLRLRDNNIKNFIALVNELKAESNQVMLNKLIDENLGKILDLKFSTRIGNKGQNPHAYELFSLTLNDKAFAKSVAKTNVQLGIRALRELAKKEVYSTEFAHTFLVAALKDTSSYIHSNVVENGVGEIRDFLFENQHHEKFHLGLNFCWAILELIEENSDLMAKDSDENQNEQVVKSIRNLMYQLSQVDPKQAHLGNLPYYIQKELLKYCQLEKEIDNSVAYNLLVGFYHSIAELQAKLEGDIEGLNYLNYLYSALQKNGDFSKANMIGLGCAYVDYIFNQRHRSFIDKSVEQFKEMFNSHEYSYGDRKMLKMMFLILLDKKRSRSDCEDWDHFTNTDSHRIKLWDELNTFISSLE